MSAGQLNRYKSRKNSWIKNLLSRGFEPRLIILDVVPVSDANLAEREYISFFGERTKLTNGTRGGDGGEIIDPSAKARIREALLGRKHSEEEKALRSESLKKFWESEEAREEKRQFALERNLKPPTLRGQANNQAVLTDQEVLKIRELASQGRKGSELAKEFNTTAATITNIVTGKTRLDAGGPIRKVKARIKLTEETVQQIRTKLEQGVVQKQVAEEFGITQGYVSEIFTNQKRAKTSK